MRHVSEQEEKAFRCAGISIEQWFDLFPDAFDKAKLLAIMTHRKDESSKGFWDTLAAFNEKRVAI